MPALDLEGSKFPYFEVLSRVAIPEGSSRRYSYWSCLCECGNRFVAAGTHLTRRVVKSCGCRKFWDSKRTKDPKTVSLRGVVNRYKQKAKYRSLSWSLTYEQAYSLLGQHCHYCGAPPSQRFNAYLTLTGNKWRKYATRQNAEAWVYTNGIDRVDNSLGYSADNCVPCCKVCNYAKRDLTLAEFQLWISRLIAFQRTKP